MTVRMLLIRKHRLTIPLREMPEDEDDDDDE